MKNKRENPLAGGAAAPVNVRGTIADLTSAVAEMESDYQADPKGFFNERDGSDRAKAMIASLQAVETRLQKFVRS